MRELKIRGSQAMDIQIASVMWTVTEWENWADKNNVGLILEDGKVTGFEEKPKRWHI